MYQSIKTEQAVLACMLNKKECSQEYYLLKVEDFTQQVNKDIYTAIKNLVKDNKNPDALTVYNYLNKKVDFSYLGSLQVPSTTIFKQYVEQLKDITIKSKLHKLADEIKNPNKSGKELIELAEKGIFELREETSVSEFTKLNNIVMDVFTEIEQIYEGKKERGLSSGYGPIDSIVGGLRKKEYILLAARPSIGKTALAINIAENLIMTNKSVAFFSYEMSKEQLVERLLKGVSYVDKRKLNKEYIPRGEGKKYEMDEVEWTKLINASSRMLNRNLFIDDDPNKSVGDMLSMCRKLKRTSGLDLVIIDYLQKVKSTERGSKREQLEYISNDIKNMAKALDVPIIAISSLSRANEQRDIKVPQLSDLRETGQLEFDADVVMFLHRDYYHKRDESIKHDADIIVAKNRNGATGRAKLMWFDDITKFMTKERGAKYIGGIK